ncbi:MAG: sulfurtransferase [Sulfobacillus thermosulfidooxidans]|nr:MAG: sulfurtransferase [Sulfobacillus thermosulfidooxidans]
MIEDVLVSPSTAFQLAQNEPVIFLDTRSADEYFHGHIPGAVNAREIFTYLATTTPEGLADLQKTFAEVFSQAGLSGQERAIVYEDAMHTGFGQSCRGYILLQYLGYPKISVIEGGFQGWLASGLPVTTEVPRPTPSVFPVNPDNSIFLTKDDVLQHLGDPHIRLLDVRDYEEWMGLSSSPYGVDFCPRKGRIPGAVWIEWHRMMDEDAVVPRFRSADHIRQACSEVGIYEDTPVFLYCFKGSRTSNTYLTLKKAGIHQVRMYFGSWNEWSRHLELPIEEGSPDSERMAARHV